MTTTTSKRLTFEEYLEYDDGTDTRYELVDGELVPMAPASPIHIAIIRFVFLQLYREVSRLGLDLEVFNSEVGIRTRERSSRLPDVCVIQGEDWRQLLESKSKAAVLQVPLVLAVEVVSPGEKAKARDYNEKPQEYAQKGIPEYWIVDPNPGKQKVTVLRLVDGSYQVAEFRGIDRIISQAFPELSLSAKSILEARS
jgi:Uma2 family endonuclease